MSLLTAGCLDWKDLVFNKSHAFLFPPFAPSSYHAVQRWMDELRVDEREASKLALVDVGDDQLVRRGQNGLRACKKLVKVLCSLATLKQMRRMLDEGSYFDCWTAKGYNKLLAYDERLFFLSLLLESLTTDP